MAASNTFRPVNSYGQIVASELHKIGVASSRALRRNVASGSLYEGAFGALIAPERTRVAVAVAGAATSVSHVFKGTIEFLDTSAQDAEPTFIDDVDCYLFPLSPTPDPADGDHIFGGYVGQLIIDGEERRLIAYC